ncbi:cytochrome P450 [Armillaria novae-zelandiae]|uniref:Cytochrome P450 n=1 Tax=Armillaria novae-zelandiae TaxID=153914 RepID=A0AA39NRV0_9AGAR|nr:cytochrome P450 [Armillaria novae-zelandiae]
MQPALYYFILPVIVYLFVAVHLRLWKRRYSIRKIRGPPRPSFLLGHEYLLASRQYVGDLEMEWYQQYGAVYRTGRCFGGSDHQRQLKILGPAFAISQLRLFLNVFQGCALKLTEKINEYVREGKEINVLQWTSKVALDIIGITAFRYEFNALNDEQSELMAALTNIFGEAQMLPKKWELLFMALWRILPEQVLSLLERLPNRVSVRLKRFKDVATKISRPIFEKQLIEVANDPDPSEKDIVNVLAMSYLADDVKKRMSDQEIDSQLATFVLAGYDTIVGAIAWLLYELSRHPEVQMKAPGALAWDDYDAMSWLNAAIKEVLRCHPVASGLLREASKDEVLPLAERIITSDGEPCSEIPISKGQVIFASVYTYNRLPSVWGDDAAEWNLCRFLEDREMKQEYLGTYANLMTFSGGVRGCLGWRFAVMAVQSVVTELLSNFEFSVPQGAPELHHGPAGAALIPIVPGKENEGPQVPLRVTPLNKEV